MLNQTKMKKTKRKSPKPDTRVHEDNVGKKFQKTKVNKQAQVILSLEIP